MKSAWSVSRVSYTSSYLGCPYENECKEDGEQWRDGCFEKKCKVRTTKDNSKESSIKIVSGGKFVFSLVSYSATPNCNDMGILSS